MHCDIVTKTTYIHVLIKDIHWMALIACITEAKTDLFSSCNLMENTSLHQKHVISII